MSKSKSNSKVDGSENVEAMAVEKMDVCVAENETIPPQVNQEHCKPLPIEIWKMILGYLGTHDLCSTRLVCQDLWNISSHLLGPEYFALKHAMKYCETDDIFSCRLVSKKWKVIASAALRENPTKSFKDVKELDQLAPGIEVFPCKESKRDFPLSSIWVDINVGYLLLFIQSFGNSISNLRLTMQSSRSHKAYPQSNWSTLHQILILCPNLKSIELQSTDYYYDDELFVDDQLPIPPLSKLKEISIHVNPRGFQHTNSTFAGYVFCLNTFRQLLKFVPSSVSLTVIDDRGTLRTYIVTQILPHVQKLEARIQICFDNDSKVFNLTDVELIKAFVSVEKIPIIQNPLQFYLSKSVVEIENVVKFIQSQAETMKCLTIASASDQYFQDNVKFCLPKLKKLTSFTLHTGKRKIWTPFTQDQFPCLTSVQLENFLDTYELFNSWTYPTVISLSLSHNKHIKSHRKFTDQLIRWDKVFQNLKELCVKSASGEYLKFIFRYFKQLEKLSFESNSTSSTNINEIISGFPDINTVFPKYMKFYEEADGDKEKLLGYLRILRTEEMTIPEPSLLDMENLKFLEISIISYHPKSPGTRISHAGVYLSILAMDPLDELSLRHTHVLGEECMAKLRALHRQVSVIPVGSSWLNNFTPYFF